MRVKIKHLLELNATVIYDGQEDEDGDINQLVF